MPKYTVVWLDKNGYEQLWVVEAASLADVESLAQTNKVNVLDIVSPGEARGQTPSPIVTTGTDIGMADEILKLHQLVTAGALTQAEFDQAKQSLLAGRRQAAPPHTVVPPPAPLRVPLVQPPAPAGGGGAMMGVGGVLLLIGGFLMYNGYQASQTFGAKLNNAIGNDAANRGIGLDMVAGFVLALVGAGLFFGGLKKSSG